MIAPDTKDWTWVIRRRCPECGFDAWAITGRDVPFLVRENTISWGRLLAAGAIVGGRATPRRWSRLEYACHVRDVYLRYRERLDLMSSEQDPLFANWDQDRSADVDRYDEQEPAKVVGELVVAGGAVADRLTGLADDLWTRPGRRSDGAVFTVDTISRYMVHDVIHHVWDVTVRDLTDLRVGLGDRA